VLVGMMGAGKSTVGRRLAQRLDRPFLDSDELIEAETGRTVAEIFAADGEAAFRAVETSVLLEMLDREVPAVIAAAGGAVLDPANRRAMRERATVVWLRVDPAVLATRVSSGGHRPLLADDPEATLSRLAAERESLYRDASDEIVDVDELTPDEVVDRVIVEIGAVA
jgi:shikimate kinase